VRVNQRDGSHGRGDAADAEAAALTGPIELVGARAAGRGFTEREAELDAEEDL
jgi:hypothetical protein